MRWRCLLAVVALTVLWTGTGSASAAVAVAASRDELTAASLLDPACVPSGPVQNDWFLPVGQALPAKHALQGKLTVSAAAMQVKELEGSTLVFGNRFPGFSVDFFAHGEALVPAERGMIRSTSGRWDIILSPGKVWSEPADGGWSRAAFPFVLVPANRWFSYNGVATFLFNDTAVSALRLQIVQEAAPPSIRFDGWAQFAMEYLPGPIEGGQALAARFEDELALQLPIRPYAALEASYDPELLATLTGNLPPEEISAAGAVIDGVLYLQPCGTRYGPFPFPRYLRHSVYS